MADSEGLQARLRKIEALMAGAGTSGERDAAGAALERVKARLAEQARRDPPVELQFSMPDAWSRQLFVALCRRYGLRPYRYRPAAHLARFSGTLQVDGYRGFRTLTTRLRDGAVTLAFCWSHLRRRFHKIHAHNGSPIAA